MPAAAANLKNQKLEGRVNVQFTSVAVKKHQNIIAAQISTDSISLSSENWSHLHFGYWIIQWSNPWKETCYPSCIMPAVSGGSVCSPTAGRWLTRCAAPLWGRCCSWLWSWARRRAGRTWPYQNKRGTLPCSRQARRSSHVLPHQEWTILSRLHRNLESREAHKGTGAVTGKTLHAEPLVLCCIHTKTRVYSPD